MNNELIAVLNYLENERGVNKERIISVIEDSLKVAAKKAVGPARDLNVKIDPSSGDIRAYANLEVVEKVQSRHDEIALEKAKETHPDVQIGDFLEYEVTPKNFGRIAAQTAKQAISSRLKKEERFSICDEYEELIGEVLSATVKEISRRDVILQIGEAEAILPRKERIPREEYNLGELLSVYLKDVSPDNGSYALIVSRAHPDLVRNLFEREVTEIAEGHVEILGIAREPGYRTKIAVKSNDSSIDPVGACVGLRGRRVKNIVRELNGEKVDIVTWDEDIKVFVTNALQPADLKHIEINEKERKLNILTADDQFSLAIGKKGRNARLASKLVKWSINIDKEEEVKKSAFQEQIQHAIEILSKIQTVDATLAEKLIKGGFLSIAGIVAADPNDLSEIEGIDTEIAKLIIENAKEIDNS
ncbi:MAG: transcription termination factor NusA [Verrucomicrobiota bacterium]|nr:transcription termination factor NusA [Verrucomicrobiota bacterium]